MSNQLPNLVRPLPPDTRSASVGAALGHLMTPTQSSGAEDAHTIQHMQAMSERSTPGDRSRARIILWAGWCLMAAILAGGLYMVGLRGDAVWFLFVCITGYGVVKTTQDENKHSPAGVERHKSEVYRDVRLAQIAADDRANARNHDTFKEVLRTVYKDNGHAEG